MRVGYTRQALADLLAIADYIGERNPAAAARAEIAIRSTIDLLTDFPKLGSSRPELDARFARNSTLAIHSLLPHRKRGDLDRAYSRRQAPASGAGRSGVAADESTYGVLIESQP
jgi:plasmid stabilization system protein ParE